MKYFFWILAILNLNNIFTKSALIIGILGQDGTYLTELLIKRNYKVYGLVRPNSTRVVSDLNLHKNVQVFNGDLLDINNLKKLLKKIKPDEIYNLAAQTQVGLSFKVPSYTAKVIALGTLNLLNAIKQTGLSDGTKLFLASSAEILGQGQSLKDLSKAKFAPRSPYAVSKLASYWLGINYRESYDMFISNGILFNHESPFRPDNFVTKKVVKAVVNIKKGVQKKLYLGNLDTTKDWGYAKDYVKAMWLSLQQEKAKDYVIATGKLNSLRNFVKLAFKEVGINLIWQGKGLREKGIDKDTKKVLVEIDTKFFRPLDSEPISVDMEKINGSFNWSSKLSLKKLISIIVKHEYNLT